MKLCGVTITDSQVAAVVKRMQASRWSEEDLEDAAVFAGVPRKKGPFYIAQQVVSAVRRQQQLDHFRAGIFEERVGNRRIYEPFNNTPYTKLQRLGDRAMASATDGVGASVHMPMMNFGRYGEMRLDRGWKVVGYGKPPYGDDRALVFEVIDGPNTGKRFWYHWIPSPEDTLILPPEESAEDAKRVEVTVKLSAREATRVSALLSRINPDVLKEILPSSEADRAVLLEGTGKLMNALAAAGVSAQC